MQLCPPSFYCCFFIWFNEHRHDWTLPKIFRWIPLLFARCSLNFHKLNLLFWQSKIPSAISQLCEQRQQVRGALPRPLSERWHLINIKVIDQISVCVCAKAGRSECGSESGLLGFFLEFSGSARVQPVVLSDAADWTLSSQLHANMAVSHRGHASHHITLHLSGPE